MIENYIAVEIRAGRRIREQWSFTLQAARDYKVRVEKYDKTIEVKIFRLEELREDGD